MFLEEKGIALGPVAMEAPGLLQRDCPVVSKHVLSLGSSRRVCTDGSHALVRYNTPLNLIITQETEKLFSSVAILDQWVMTSGPMMTSVRNCQAGMATFAPGAWKQTICHQSGRYLFFAKLSSDFMACLLFTY